MIRNANGTSGSPSFGEQLIAAAASGRLLRAVGASNAIAAAVATEAGFDALWVSGLEVSTSLGLPDENVLTPCDLAGSVAAITRVSTLPVVVDIDNAGGSPATARRFAADLARAGRLDEVDRV